MFMPYWGAGQGFCDNYVKLSFDKLCDVIYGPFSNIFGNCLSLFHSKRHVLVNALPWQVSPFLFEEGNSDKPQELIFSLHCFGLKQWPT